MTAETGRAVPISPVIHDGIVQRSLPQCDEVSTLSRQRASSSTSRASYRAHYR